MNTDHGLFNLCLAVRSMRKCHTRQAAISIDYLRLPEIDFSLLRKRVLLSSATRTTDSEQSGWIRCGQPDTAESVA